MISMRVLLGGIAVAMPTQATQNRRLRAKEAFTHPQASHLRQQYHSRSLIDCQLS